MIIPFRLEDELFEKMPDGQMIAYSDLTWFVVSKTNNKYEYEIVTRYPDLDWQQGKSNSFTGTIIVEDINGDFIKGYAYKGSEIRKVTRGLANGRTQERVCNYIDHYSCGSRGNISYGCTLDRTEELGCTEVQDLDHDKFDYLDGKWYPNFSGCQVCYGTSV